MRTRMLLNFILSVIANIGANSLALANIAATCPSATNALNPTDTVHREAIHMKLMKTAKCIVKSSRSKFADRWLDR